MLICSFGLFDLIIELLLKLITSYIKLLISFGHKRQLGRIIMFCPSYDKDKKDKSK